VAEISSRRKWRWSKALLTLLLRVFQKYNMASSTETFSLFPTKSANSLVPKIEKE